MLIISTVKLNEIKWTSKAIKLFIILFRHKIIFQTFELKNKIRNKKNNQKYLQGSNYFNH